MVTKYNYVPFEGRSWSRTKSKTEKYGYIPAKKQIENLMVAGKRLDAYKAGMYMYNAGSFENFSVMDVASLQMPFYNDELSLAEKTAYMSGVKKAFAESIQKEKDDAVKAEKEARFNEIVSGFQTAFSQLKPTGESTESTPSEIASGKA